MNETVGETLPEYTSFPEPVMDAELNLDEAIYDLAEQPNLPPLEKHEIEEISRRTLLLQPFVSRIVRNQFSHKDLGEAELDLVTGDAQGKFLERICDGRIRNKYETEDDLKNVLGRIARCTAIDRTRKVRGRTGQNIEFVSLQNSTADGEDDRTREDLIGVEDEGYDGVERRLSSNRMLRLVWPMMSDREREILTMKAFTDLSSDEIAEKLGTTRNSVDSHFSHLKKKVRSFPGIAERGLSIVS